MVYFSKIDLWYLIPTEDSPYLIGRVFEVSECRILLKAYLLPLFTTKLDANYNKDSFNDPFE